MERITQERFNEMVKLHVKFLDGCDDGVLFDASYKDLSGIDGSDARLVRASLDGARLDGARLDGARLDGASLDGASLVRASLDGASLVRASLDGASLDGARLWSCVGNKENIKSIQCDKYDVTYTHDRMQIGCQNHTIEEWFNFGNREIAAMDIGALKWWKIWKPILKTIIKTSPAKPTNS